MQNGMQQMLKGVQQGQTDFSTRKNEVSICKTGFSICKNRFSTCKTGFSTGKNEFRMCKIGCSMGKCGGSRVYIK
jgi:hypothetical protein